MCILNAVLPRKRKKLISIRIEPELLDWYKLNYPGGYQAKMRELLTVHARIQMDKSVRLAGQAQELFRRFHAQCFWHLDRDFQITPSNMYLVIEGLKKHGGREGFLIAEELCH